MAHASAPFVTRHADALTVGLSPTNRFAFPFAERDGDHPEVYVESAGRGDGPPVHQHGWPTWELVLEGEVLFQVDGQDFLLGAGDAMYTPPGVAHAYMVKSDTARLVGINGAGGRLSRLQRRAEPLFAAGGPPDMRQVAAIAAEEGVTVMGPPLKVSRG